jgi:hypothetical protein
MSLKHWRSQVPSRRSQRYLFQIIIRHNCVFDVSLKKQISLSQVIFENVGLLTVVRRCQLNLDILFYTGCRKINVFQVGGLVGKNLRNYEKIK